MKTKALIINHNRLALLKNAADWCFNHGLEPIIIDNCSDYLPLLEYYKTCPYQVLKLNRNYGSHAIWDANIINKLEIKDDFIITDPDLDLTGIPDDFLSVLKEGLMRYPVVKCGFSLSLNNLPEGKTKEWERSLWSRPLDDQYFRAPIATTFALYRKDIRKWVLSPSVRTNSPYTAIHIPWGYESMNFKDLPEDEQYYFKTANETSTGKERVMCGKYN